MHRPQSGEPCVTDKRATTKGLATHPAVKSIDFTGGNVFGQWLIDNCRQAQVSPQWPGVSNIVIDSTDAYKAMRQPRRLHPVAQRLVRLPPPALRRRPAASRPKTGPRLRVVRRSGRRPRALPGQARGGSRRAGRDPVRRHPAERIELANSGTLGKVVLASSGPSQPRFPRPPRCYPGAAGLRCR